MSIKLNSQAGTYVRRTTGLGASSAQTLLVWHRRTGTNPSTAILTTWSSGSGYLTVDYNGSGLVSVAANFSPSYTTQPTHTLNEWAAYAFVLSGSTASLYFWNKDKTRSTILNGNGATVSGAPSEALLGDRLYNASAVGEYRYFRFWNRALNTTELDAEVASSSVVSSTNLTGNWPLDNDTDTTDDSGNGNTLTFTGTIIDSTEEPPTGGASAVAAIAGRHYARMRAG